MPTTTHLSFNCNFFVIPSSIVILYYRQRVGAQATARALECELRTLLVPPAVVAAMFPMWRRLVVPQLHRQPVHSVAVL